MYVMYLWYFLQLERFKIIYVTTVLPIGRVFIIVVIIFIIGTGT